MVMGLALFTPLGLGGAVFYMVHNIFAKANLFLIAGIARWYGGSFELKKLGGLYRHRPLLAVLFVIAAFSLAGFPPLSGFWAKLVVIRAGFEVEAWPLVAVALFVGLLTLYSMTKIWLAAFWSPVPEGVTLRAGPAPALLYLPVIALALLTLAMGFASAPFFALAERIGAELSDPAGYVLAVLGEAAAAAFVAQGVAP
jgi:multicomponent Na+:H+ antiporter subunit D